MMTAETVSGLRQRVADRALRDIPKLLTLQDRNPHSATYGCFDRNYWHYRIVDFPSGMTQEFVLPLALVWRYAIPGNSFHQQPAIREWVAAGIRFAASSAYADGSCDDYFLYEKAAGAAVFSLYAAIRAIELCDLDADEFKPFLIRRGKWLATHKESGRLGNHEALIANTLFRLADLTADGWFEEQARRRLERLTTWRSSEGWFTEYDGAEPGYLTLTIAMLAEIDHMRPNLSQRGPIAGAVRFLHEIQPPDGWLGGEWSSRNTHNYFPHGVELCADWLQEACDLNTRAIQALEVGPEYSDDRVVAHHCWSYLLTWLHWRDERPVPQPVGNGLSVFPEAGIVMERRGNDALLLATRKGGALRFYAKGRLVHADTGISLRVGDGPTARIAVCHLTADDNTISVAPGSVVVSGAMAWAKTQRMTPLKQIGLRLFMMTIGRLDPDLVRKLLQRLLIVGRDIAPFRFRRTVEWSADGLLIEDTIEALRGWSAVSTVGVGPAQGSIYTVMSKVWHPSQLQLWEDLTDHKPQQPAREMKIRRRFG